MNETNSNRIVRTLQTLWRGVALVVKTTETVFFVLGLIALFVMAVLMTVNALLRYGFHSGIPSTTTIVSYLLMPATICLVAPILQRNEGNIAVTIVSQRFPPYVNDALAVIWKSASLLMVGGIVYICLPLGYRLAKSGAVSPGIIRVPEALPWLIIGIGFGFLCIRLAGQLIGHVKRVIDHVR